MLLRFAFQNHASFRDANEVSFIGSPLKAPAGRRAPTKDAPHGVTRVAALYGGNASGKSSVLDALVAMRAHVLRSHVQYGPTERIARNPFRLDRASRDAPTRMEAEFVVDGCRYRYGFECTEREYSEEWLHAWPNERKQEWFHRVGQERERWYFGPSLAGRKATIAELTRPNSLFLSVAAQNNHAELGRVHRFFAEQIVLGMDSDHVHRPLLYRDGPLIDDSNRDVLRRLLRAADLGVMDVEIRPREEPLAMDYASSSGPRAPSPLEIVLRHEGPDGHAEWLEPRLESRGTVTLLNQLGPILAALRSGAVVLVDELDASLHTRLSSEIVGLFVDPESNPRGAQLLFTTHDEALLEVLHRDEVVLVDKDAGGVSRLTALTDYKTLARDNIRKAYHLGRFGGVPRVGSLARELGGARGRG